MAAKESAKRTTLDTQTTHARAVRDAEGELEATTENQAVVMNSRRDARALREIHYTEVVVAMEVPGESLLPKVAPPAAQQIPRRTPEAKVTLAVAAAVADAKPAQDPLMTLQTLEHWSKTRRTPSPSPCARGRHDSRSRCLALQKMTSIYLSPSTPVQPSLAQPRPATDGAVTSEWVGRSGAPRRGTAGTPALAVLLEVEDIIQRDMRDWVAAVSMGGVVESATDVEGLHTNGMARMNAGSVMHFTVKVGRTRISGAASLMGGPLSKTI